MREDQFSHMSDRFVLVPLAAGMRFKDMAEMANEHIGLRGYCQLFDTGRQA
ncbi:hypothetical protein JANAI61_02640 [Jannaschia sp. AI_61]|nr:hypothetical protein JANAI61_02640 [Jannaschia sp. AI_61]